MTIQDEMKHLLALQQLDSRTADIRAELEKIPAEIDELRHNVETVRAILRKEQARVDEADGWRREKEAEIALQNDLLAKSKSKLQAARNERESKAAQREVDTIKKIIADYEKELLELLEAIEQYRQTIAEHEKEFAALEEQLAQRVEEGNARMEEIRVSLATVDGDRQAIIAQISQPTVRLYERLRKRIHPVVVAVSEPICPGCNFEIRPQAYLELQRGDKLVTCTSCMRIFALAPAGGEEPVATEEQ